MPKLIIELEPDTHKKLKMLALDDDRSLIKYITRGLEYLANMPTPYHRIIGGAGIIPTPVEQQPFVYTPTTTTTTPIPDTSQMTGLEQQEYARKQAAEAKTKLALERQDARTQPKALTPEEEQLNQQKLELQKQKMQEKRDELIRNKAKEINLDIWDLDNYNEDHMLFDMYGDDYLLAKDQERRRQT